MKKTISALAASLLATVALSQDESEATTDETAVPEVQKAVKWNTPFYGLDGKTWFISFHCLTKYVKVAFLKGSSLEPMPPGTSKQADARYLDIYEQDEIDEAQFTDWVKQASLLPGEKL